jgi:hypothetical protein
MLVRKLIADVRETLRKRNVDDRIPAPFIYNKLIKFASLLIKRESDSRKIFSQTHIFKNVEFKLEDYNGYKRSILEIPSFFSTNYGNLLVVGATDYTNAYKQTVPEAYERTKYREFKDPNNRYYWIENKHLVIPDNFLRFVNVRGLFYDYKELPCQSILDTDFPCPDYLMEEVLIQTVNSLTLREKIVEDTNPDLDVNNKN